MAMLHIVILVHIVTKVPKEFLYSVTLTSIGSQTVCLAVYSVFGRGPRLAGGGNPVWKPCEFIMSALHEESASVLSVQLLPRVWGKPLDLINPLLQEQRSDGFQKHCKA